VLDWTTPGGVHILISADVGPPPAEITREELLRVAASMQPAFWAKLLKVSPNLEEKIVEATSEQELRTFLESGQVRKDTRLLLAITRNPHCPPALLRELSADSSPTVEAALIGSERTPPDVIRKLSEHLTDDSAYSIASHPNTPPDVFHKLLEWKASYGATCYTNIAYNRSAPPDVLRAISKSSDRSADVNLLSNPSTPIDILEDLANSPDAGIRFAASNALAKRRAQGNQNNKGPGSN